MGQFEFKDCEVVRMKLADLKPAEYNPRRMTDKAFDGLGHSIDKFGLMVPIVWNRNSGNIVGGHQRFRYLVETGEIEADVVVVELDDHEEVALNIALNSGELRGSFTEDVKGALSMVEATLGSTFNELRLDDLFSSLKFASKKPKDATSGSSGSDAPPEPDAGPDAVITCPKCRSKWRMKDGGVIADMTVEASHE